MTLKRSGYLCVRSTFCALNGLLWILGCCTVGLALWLRVRYGGYVSVVPQFGVFSMDTVILLGGVLLFATAFLGCCGSWCKNKCLLISYFSLVAILCILELLGGILGFTNQETVNVTLKQELLRGIRIYYNSTDNSDGLVLAWDHVQQQLGCCGVENYEDWFKINAWHGQNYVPNSCCKAPFLNITGCGKSGESDMWHSNGCLAQVRNWLVDRLHLVGITGIVIALVQLFGLMSSMLLFCAMRRRAGLQSNATGSFLTKSI